MKFTPFVCLITLHFDRTHKIGKFSFQKVNGVSFGLKGYKKYTELNGINSEYDSIPWLRLKKKTLLVFTLPLKLNVKEKSITTEFPSNNQLYLFSLLLF